MMKTFRKLRKLALEILDEYPHINLGGCCVFAVFAAKRLSKIFPTRIVVFDDETNVSIDEAREEVWSNKVYHWNDVGVCFGHVVVEIQYNGRWYHYDADGLRRRQTYWEGDTLVRGYLTLQEAYELAMDPNGWNSKFNRKDIPKIRRKINKFFKEEVLA